MPESPRYLVSIGKLAEAEKAFATVARYNGRPLEWDEKAFEKSSVPAYQEVPFTLQVGNLPPSVDEEAVRTWLSGLSADVASSVDAVRVRNLSI